MSDKPKRLYYKSYIAMLENAPGTALFKNLYVQQADGTQLDAMADGDNACAYFVSSVLTIFQKITGLRGTVAGTLQDMLEHGWKEVGSDKLMPGDVVVWEKQLFNDGLESEHIGFYLTGNLAVSTSSIQKTVVKHDLHPTGQSSRAIDAVYRAEW